MGSDSARHNREGVMHCPREAAVRPGRLSERFSLGMGRCCRPAGRLQQQGAPGSMPCWSVIAPELNG